MAKRRLLEIISYEERYLLIGNVKESFWAKVASYQASAGMAACLALSGLFALGAGVVWLSDYIGSIGALLSVSAAFLVLALIFKLVSGVKDEEASDNIEEAGEQVGEAVSAVSTVAKTAASIPAKPSMLVPALVVAGILLVVFDQSRSREEHAWPPP